MATPGSSSTGRLEGTTSRSTGSLAADGGDSCMITGGVRRGVVGGGANGSGVVAGSRTDGQRSSGASAYPSVGASNDGSKPGGADIETSCPSGASEAGTVQVDGSVDRKLTSGMTRGSVSTAVRIGASRRHSAVGRTIGGEGAGSAGLPGATDGCGSAALPRPKGHQRIPAHPASADSAVIMSPAIRTKS